LGDRCGSMRWQRTGIGEFQPAAPGHRSRQRLLRDSVKSRPPGEGLDRPDRCGRGVGANPQRWWGIGTLHARH